MTRDAPLPVTIIGGYLGAGKTTVLNHLLRHADGRRIAVLVNDFGQLAIDADLIEAEDEDMISIAGGCICCSFGDDLTGALGDMAERVPPPDHVVIETSGVAMPGAIAANIGLMPQLLLSGVIVLADTDTISRQMRDDYIGDTVIRQMTQADLIVLTKTDLVAPTAASGVADQVQGAVPGARIMRARQGEIPPDVLLGQMAGAVARNTGGHADRDYESHFLDPAPVPDPAALASALADPALGLLRAKGFVTAPSGQVHLIQIVGARSETRPVQGDHPSGVVCIGLKDRIDVAGLRRLLTPVA